MLTAALKTHKGDASVILFTCSALRTLADISAGADACAGCGAIGLLAEALRVHSWHEGVCEQAAAALRNIGWSRTFHRQAIVGAGAVALLVASHENHPGTNAARRAQEALDKLGYSATGVERHKREKKSTVRDSGAET